MRWVVGCGGILAAVVAAAILFASRETPKKQPPKKRGSAAVVVESKADAKPVQSKPKSAAVDRAQVVGLLKEALELARAKKIKQYGEVLQKLIALGVQIQGVLVELLRGEGDDEFKSLVASVLLAVADEGVAGEALSLLRHTLPIDAKAALIKLLTRLKYDGADPVLQAMLFDPDVDPRLRPLIVEYYSALGGDRAVGVAQELLKSDLRDLYVLAGEMLAKVGSRAAAAVLVDAWNAIYAASKKGDLLHYQLLQMLAKFDTALVREIFDTHLAREKDLSKKNFLISVLARMESSFAMLMVRDVLAAEKDYRVRQQAIMVLARFDSRESQELLLDLIVRREHIADAVEALNSLQSHSKLHVDFDRVRSLFEKEDDPDVQVMLGNVLTRYELPEDLREKLARVAAGALQSPEEALRANAVQLLSSLARYGSDPVGRLLELRSKIPDAARHPMILTQLANYTDERAQAVFTSILNDESAAQHERYMAAQYVAAHDRARAYDAIKSTKDVELSVFLMAAVVEKGGPGEIKKLTEIAKTLPEDERRSVLLEQLKVWGEISSGNE